MSSKQKKSQMEYNERISSKLHKADLTHSSILVHEQTKNNCNLLYNFHKSFDSNYKTALCFVSNELGDDCSLWIIK